MEQQNFAELIKSKADIVDVIGQYISLSKKGKNHWGVCPFHNDTKPSLSVSSERQLYNCFSCEAKGDVIGFVKRFENISYREALLKVAKMVGINQDVINQLTRNYQIDNKHEKLYSLNAHVNKWFVLFLDNKENSSALKYLHDRQINDDVIKTFEIGFAPKQNRQIVKMATNEDKIMGNILPQDTYDIKQLDEVGLVNLRDDGIYYDFFYNRITFPIKDEYGRIVGFSAREYNQLKSSKYKYINTGTTPIFHKEGILYNLDRVKRLEDNDALYVVEGFMDVIACYRAGIINVVATMGVAFTSKHLNLLQANLPHLKVINLCFDNDSAGQAAIINSVNILHHRYSLYVVDAFPNNIKDADELINQLGIDDAKTALNKTNDLISYLLALKISKSKNLENKINQEALLNWFIATIKKYGSNLYLMEQITTITNVTNFNEATIKELLQPVIKQTKQYRQSNYSNKSRINLPNNEAQQNDDVSEALFNLEEDLIRYFCYDVHAIDIFHVKLNQFFHKDLRNLATLIEQYYVLYPNVTKINKANIDHVVTYLDNPKLANTLQNILYFQINYGSVYEPAMMPEILNNILIKRYEKNINSYIDKEMNITDDEMKYNKVKEKIEEMLNHKRDLELENINLKEKSKQRK